jgi:AraC family transcriptional regulator of adaptative response/methylated-DNA-[protein]-cysteine methyltransferase
MQPISLSYDQQVEDYNRVEQAIEFIDQNFQRQPSLAEVAEAVHLSEYHFQRLFTRWVGISPKRFLQFLTREYARNLLAESWDILQATYASGLSSPGRLHDLFIQTEAVTPGETRRLGAGLTIRYGYHPSLFGEVLLAVTERGICYLGFVRNNGREETLHGLKARWPLANFEPDPEAIRKLGDQIFSADPHNTALPLPVHLTGTNFQIQVWQALLRIPPGQIASYEQVAAGINKPEAVRAVAHAIGQNPVPFIIPCHRVIRKLGDFGEYGGGSARKKAILGWEFAHAERVQEELA